MHHTRYSIALQLVVATLATASTPAGDVTSLTSIVAEPGPATTYTTDASGKMHAEQVVGANIAAARSTSGDGSLQLFHNFVGQLYDTKTITLAASPDPAPEASFLTLAASQIMDDGSRLPVPTSEVSWAIGRDTPLSAISPQGTTSTHPVPTDTQARITGSWHGHLSTLSLTVSDTIEDNYGTYAGDGLSDRWQFAFFGSDSPDAHPDADPDRDGQNNAAEEAAGFSPVDPTKKLALTLKFTTDGDAVMTVNKVIPGRTYTLLGGGSPGSLHPITLPWGVAGGPPRLDFEYPLGALTNPRYFYQLKVTR